MSYTGNGAGIEVIEENNYYPFGLKHEGYNNLGGNSAYQYKYNGKELQETGMYDYGARMYMPDLGRWGVVDPLAETSRRWSPYTYVFNNPLRFIDPDGRQGTDVYKIDKSGHLSWVSESKTDVIYTEDQFETDGKTVKEGEQGYEIGEKGFISNHFTQYNFKGDKYMNFGSDENKALEYFNQIGDWMKNGKIKVEFSIQTATENNQDRSVVYTSHSSKSVDLAYWGDNVKLIGHLHPGESKYLEAWSSMQLNPSGFEMSQFPTKENGYSFKVNRVSDSGDNLSAKSNPNAILFIYAPSYNTTIIYKYNQYLKAYEGKFKK